MRLCGKFWTAWLVVLIARSPLAAQVASSPAASAPAAIPELVYRAELVAFPGPWAFQIGRSAAILVSDEQLEQLAQPDQVVNLSLGPTPQETTLRKICERAKTASQRTLVLAFDQFFTRLANDGINSSNTLFVFTADENDHFAGGTPTNACDGVNTPCVYSHVNCPSLTVPVCPSDNVGELNANMAGLLATQQGITTPFRVHSDSSPTVYITGNPTRTDPVTRDFERATGNLMATNFYTGATENMTLAMADPVEMDILHMVTADPFRTPTFTWFAKPDYYVYAAAPNCNSPCVAEQFGFAWNHGDITSDITTTWMGMVGPGIQRKGIDSQTWSDHADVRPTILALTGLKDDYEHDGRVLIEDLQGWAMPEGMRESRGLLLQLARMYKQINAPVGELGLATLAISTRALQSNDAGDATYTDLENQLISINTQRDALASQMIALLEDAAFNHHEINKKLAQKLIKQGQALLDQVNALAAAP